MRHHVRDADRDATAEDWPAIWRSMRGIAARGNVLVGPRHRRQGGARLLAARRVGACLRRRRRRRDGRRNGRDGAPPGRPGGAHRERGLMVDPAHFGRGAGRALGEPSSPGPARTAIARSSSRGGRVRRARRRPVALTGLRGGGHRARRLPPPVHGYVGLHVMHPAAGNGDQAGAASRASAQRRRSAGMTWVAKSSML